MSPGSFWLLYSVLIQSAFRAMSEMWTSSTMPFQPALPFESLAPTPMRNVVVFARLPLNAASL